MQVTHTASQIASPRLVQSNPRTPTPSKAFFDAAQSGTMSDAVRGVFQKYSVHNISPREVDQMVRELGDAGFQDAGALLTLQTHGEAFMSHLKDSIFQATGHTPSAAEKAAFTRRLTTPIDLVQSLYDSADMSRRYGGSGDAQERLAGLLDQMDTDARIAASSQPSATTQSLIEAQMAASQYAA